MENIYAMVHNFEILCCNDSTCKIKARCRQRFTNFTMNEILKPEFGSIQNRFYDSDGTYMSDSSDVYSSTDDYQDFNSSRSISPEIAESDQPGVLETQRNSILPTGFSTLHRFQQKYEDDGYLSTDSESALDLRIARKKTPPKMMNQLPAWVFCTRYSDRPSTGRRARKRKSQRGSGHKRTRTAFDETQLQQLNVEFEKDPYLSETRRRILAQVLSLSETNVKIWFQNRRAKLKKTIDPHPLALQLQAQGLYNHKSSVDTD